MVFPKSTLALAVLAIAATSLLSVVDAEEKIIRDGEEQLISFTEGLMDDDKAKACCDSCLCTRSIPPRCQCTDQQKKQCYPGCKTCRCTRSWPPTCRCMDINNFCYPQCSPPPSSACGPDCKLCLCTKSFPPSCFCKDAPTPKPSPSSKCSDDCKVCKCTRSFPPTCSCADA
ncbi:hypothetical protein MKW94_026523 [Papaver nudicaule]|uniref:Bowman-Birk serine protease inhibitors family domain-containing protein n=1 Tax=Papaver nudicaule TaxID=74823 RepID=A0AA41S499_PAPNU|nr:hypothetical protein [Papaver nudicaule]